MIQKIEIINTLKRAVHERDDEAFLACLTDDIEYHYHVGSRPLIGKEWVRRFLERYHETVADLDWTIKRYAETEHEVFVEGTEEYLDRRTKQKISHPYMGIFEFRDGRIAGWRDYFQMGESGNE